MDDTDATVDAADVTTLAMQADAPSVSDGRIASIDVLRGVAILGILVMNIQSFAMPEVAYVNPRAFGSLEGANGIVYAASHVFASGKFISIFSMLFGAGLALQAMHGLTASRHYRRMAVLAAFGLVHAYVFWHGDILFTYAVVGSLAFLLRGLAPRWLFACAGGAFLCGLLLNAALFGLVQLAVAFGEGESIRAEFAPSAEVLADEVHAFQGSWLDQMPYRASTALMVQTFLLALWSLPVVSALMLVGMGLVKLRFFDAWPRSRWAMIAVIGCLLGWTIAGLQLVGDAWSGHDPLLTTLAWPTVNLFAMPLVAVGYAAAVCWIVATLGASPVLWPLAAVGRTALSCYLLTTLICTTIFYGHGLGWFGEVDRVGQMFVTVCVWVVLLTIAPLWLRFSEQGPMEWLWRRLAYGR